MLLFTGKIIHRSGQMYTSLFRRCHFYRLNLTTNLVVPKKRYTISFRKFASESIKFKNVNKSAVAVARKKPKLSELQKLFALAEPEKWRLIGAIALLIVSSGVTMTVPFLIGKVIDIIYTEDKAELKSKINKVSLVMLGVFLIGGICNFGRVYLMTTTGYKITQNLRKTVYSSILKQETAMFDKVSTGELVGRLTGDAQLVSSSITTNISDGLRSGIMCLACVSMMIYISPKLAMVGLLVVPPVSIMAVFYGRFVKNITRDVQNSLALLNTTAEEKISNIRVVKAFGKELSEIKHYDSKLQDLLKLCYKESFYRGLFFGAAGFSGNAIALSVLYYGGVMVSDEAITVGNLSSFLLYAAYVGVSLGGLSSFYTELNKALGASTRLFELIDRKGKLPIEGGIVLENLFANIKFEDVTFTYPTRKDLPILQNVNLEVEKGSTLALVGPSGSGKSTLALLLVRLYDPDSGKILLDGNDIKKLDPLWMKSQFGMVSQEPILFNGTIRENIMYGKEEASEAEISEAARQANVLEFVQRMPNGLETVVGERGVTLSGGQRQRVVIARALIKNPKVLILDEATSALDAESECFVQEALERVRQGRTVLIIAHRLSTIKNANMIAVLDRGRVVESGTYTNLVAKESGLFKRLVQHQTFK